MQRVDGELDDVSLDSESRKKADAIGELGELVRGHVELAADEIPESRFDAMWKQIDQAIEPPIAKPVGFWRRVARWFDQYRGHLITGAVSAGAVAALALVLRGNAGHDQLAVKSTDHDSSPIVPVVYRPTEIQSLDTPGGESQVWDLDDEDGSSTVIWVTPSDTVEGI
jgi:hypothetical protein